MKKRQMIIIGIIIVILILLGIYLKVTILGKVIDFPDEDSILLTKESFPGYFEKKEIVKTLPEKALISVRLYNFNTGNREWEESYIVKKSSVEQGQTENPDVKIIIHSKYVSELGNLCATVKKSKANGDFGFDTEMSKIAFLWKYKNAIKYKNCFGY